MTIWSYSNARTQSTGIMRCAKCNRGIDGEYRYRETPHKYINIHKECSLDDPEWARLELRAKNKRDKDNAYDIAKLKFIEKWGERATSDFCRDEDYQ